ncbi:hypothetical protein CRE_24559 [Caenorhabditis remanei]|uniref:Uncharacterized protein n=1 Tax=Caenorhabditis remanei TaxID=31234 RepID=E3MVE6_CAERE|nr:hypothetical protein CRE_24559 [Caenorhabditis remanei]
MHPLHHLLPSTTKLQEEQRHLISSWKPGKSDGTSPKGQRGGGCVAGLHARLWNSGAHWIFEETVSPRLALPIESVTVVDPPAVNPGFPTEMLRTAGFVSLEDTGSIERSLLDILRELPHNSRIQLEIQERRSFPNADFIQLIQTWIESPQEIGRRFSVNIRFNWRLQKRIQETFPMCQKQWIQMTEKRASSRRGISIDTFHDQRLVVYGRNGRDGLEKHKWTTMEVFPRHV